MGRVLTSACALALLVAPATASARDITITGDDGAPVPANGAGVHRLDPQLTPVLDAGDQRFRMVVTGPGGAQSADTGCFSRGYAKPEGVDYLGNGAYTAVLRAYASDDYSCTRAATAETAATFSIVAGTGLGMAPGQVFLLRRPNSYDLIPVAVPFSGVQDADGYDIAFSGNPALAPDGSLVGPARSGTVDPATGQAVLRFDTPGTYTATSRAVEYNGGTFGTPWSPPVTFRVVAPFDRGSLIFTDSRGPSYRLRLQLRERTATGRVRIEIARNWTGRARYRRLGTVRIGALGVATKRFKVRRTGRYRLRFTTAGSGTLAPGHFTERIQTRRFISATP